MSTVSQIGEQRVRLDNIRWSTYLAILEDTPNCRGRITYDHGVLEIMSPSKNHENVGRLLGRMVETFTEEMQIEIVSVASTTVKREEFQQGFEADEAYYIQSAELVRHKTEIDPLVDPAPDLVIEVDISRSSMGKLPIFQAFQVPEAWRYRGETLFVYILSDDQYVLAKTSVVLPGFPLEQAERILNQKNSVGETELIRGFRAWIREHVS